MRPPAFPLYPDNWFGSCRIASMLPEQEGAYLRLLCYQWNSEDQTIPADDASLSCLSRLNGRWQTLGAKVKSCFRDSGPGKMRNERLFAEWKKAVDYREKKAAAGRKGMEVRYGNRETTPPQQPANAVTTPLEHCNNLQTQTHIQSSEAVSKKGRGSAAGKPATPSFKAWTRVDLEKSVAEANASGLLSTVEAEAFLDHWSEPAASGRPRCSLEKTWDTALRIKKWRSNEDKWARGSTGKTGGGLKSIPPLTSSECANMTEAEQAEYYRTGKK